MASCFLVVEPRSRISRGFAFITMDTTEDANRCIKHLNQSVLEHRQITVERVSYTGLCSKNLSNFFPFDFKIYWLYWISYVGSNQS